MDNNNSGFSLISVMVAMAMLAMVTMAYVLTDITRFRAEKTLKEHQVAHSLTQTYLARLDSLQFGHLDYGPGERIGEQADMVFGSDQPLGVSAPTLMQLASISPMSFNIAGTPAKGRWTVIIDNDLDGDGFIDVEDDLSREGRNDIVRIVILYDGRTMTSTKRAVDITQQYDEEGIPR
jgi:type II secretory pathway pseudopilin PulG